MLQAVRFCYACNDKYEVDASVRSCPVCSQVLAVLPSGTTHELLELDGRDTRFEGSLLDACDEENLVGRDLGSYSIEEFVGRGGMARVYKATHRTLHRPCALKVLNPKLIARDPRFVPLFLSEARHAAALVHPHVVTVHNICEEEGYHFIEMEFVEGYSLRRTILETGPLDVALATDILAQVCGGLALAHHRGMVHRDMKPANILITMDGLAKIADFGLAKRIVADGADIGNTGIRQTGLAGTPLFMAPELFEGKHATSRSDVYAVGVTYHFALTGMLPYLGTTLHEIAELHRTSSLPDPREDGVEVPESVVRLLRLCLAKNPRGRYPDASALGAELQQILSHLRDIDELVGDVLGGLGLAWEGGDGRFQTVVHLPKRRTQRVYIDVIKSEPLAGQLVRIYSVCAPVDETYYRRALELNADLPHGSIAIQEIDGRPHYIMVDTYPQLTCDAEELRRSVLAIARGSDDVERILTSSDRY